MTNLSTLETAYPFGLKKEAVVNLLTGLIDKIQSGDVIPQEVEESVTHKSELFAVSSFTLRYVEKRDGEEG